MILKKMYYIWVTFGHECVLYSTTWGHYSYYQCKITGIGITDIHVAPSIFLKGVAVGSCVFLIQKHVLQERFSRPVGRIFLYLKVENICRSDHNPIAKILTVEARVYI